MHFCTYFENQLVQHLIQCLHECYWSFKIDSPFFIVGLDLNIFQDLDGARNIRFEYTYNERNGRAILVGILIWSYRTKLLRMINVWNGYIKLMNEIFLQKNTDLLSWQFVEKYEYSDRYSFYFLPCIDNLKGLGRKKSCQIFRNLWWNDLLSLSVVFVHERMRP